MLVGLLGILKVGGAYVSLDPAYPTERLALMLQDTPISVLLTQARLVESLLGFCSINTVIRILLFENSKFSLIPKGVSLHAPTNLNVFTYFENLPSREK